MQSRQETTQMNLGSQIMPKSSGKSLGRKSLGRRRFTALAVAAALLSPLAALLAAPAAQAQAASSSGLTGIQIPTVPPEAGPIHTILLFPFANAIPASVPATGFNLDVVGARVESAIKTRLNVIGIYKADSFSPTLPQIQRALQESGVESFGENDIAPPYDSSPKGQKLADQIATDGYLMGTIEALKVDTATRTVSLTVSATLYNTSTGTAVKALAYTGRGVSYNVGDDPESLLQSAIDDTAGHIVSALDAAAPQEARAALAPDLRRSRHKSSHIGNLALGLILAAAIAIGITAAHHSHSSGSGTTTTTPTTPTVPVVSSGPPPPPTGG